MVLPILSGTIPAWQVNLSGRWSHSEITLPLPTTWSRGPMSAREPRTNYQGPRTFSGHSVLTACKANCCRCQNCSVVFFCFWVLFLLEVTLPSAELALRIPLHSSGVLHKSWVCFCCPQLINRLVGGFGQQALCTPDFLLSSPLCDVIVLLLGIFRKAFTPSTFWPYLDCVAHWCVWTVPSCHYWPDVERSNSKSYGYFCFLWHDCNSHFLFHVRKCCYSCWKGKCCPGWYMSVPNLNLGSPTVPKVYWCIYKCNLGAGE
jgi:hypothetical protein